MLLIVCHKENSQGANDKNIKHKAGHELLKSELAKENSFQKQNNLQITRKIGKGISYFQKLTRVCM